MNCSLNKAPHLDCTLLGCVFKHAYGSQAYPKNPFQVAIGLGAPVAANRGASGIDGVMSSAAGFAFGLNRPATLLVGDVSFLHDINGLNLLRTGARHFRDLMCMSNGQSCMVPGCGRACPESLFRSGWALYGLRTQKHAVTSAVQLLK